MVHILLSTHPLLKLPQIETEKDGSHRIFLLVSHQGCDFAMCSLDGKGALQMGDYGRKLEIKDFISLMASITLEMQDFHCAELV